MQDTPEPGYVAARAALLEVLDALGVHRESVVLVGAQAIYLHTGNDLPAVAPYTTDADLAINPRVLARSPALESVLHDAGFELTRRPGTWSRAGAGVEVDLLVPSTLAGPGRRRARLPGHSPDVARKATGLEAVLIDNSLVAIGPLALGEGPPGAIASPNERRSAACPGPSFTIRVAGLAALLVVKLIQINDRRSTPELQQNQDGLDVLRILRNADAELLGSTLTLLSDDRLTAHLTIFARGLLETLFSRPHGHGVALAIDARGGLEHPDTTALSCILLAERLLDTWQVHSYRPRLPQRQPARTRVAFGCPSGSMF